MAAQYRISERVFTKAFSPRLTDPIFKAAISTPGTCIAIQRLSTDKVERLKELRKQVRDTKNDEDAVKFLAKEKDILLLARYNANNEPILISKLIDLAKNDQLNRDYTVEERRILDYNRQAGKIPKMIINV